MRRYIFIFLLFFYATSLCAATPTPTRASNPATDPTSNIASPLNTQPTTHQAQPHHQTKHRHTLGLTSGYMFEVPPKAYYYRGVLIEVNYRYTFFSNRWCNLQVSGNLHYTPTHYSATAFPTNDYRNGYELGFTFGLLWAIRIYKEHLSGYLGGFIGPMYTPNMPARQGGKLNFSDNLCLGFHIKLYNFLHLDLRYAYRHMSNANFWSPNYGLNDHCLGIGLFYKF